MGGSFELGLEFEVVPSLEFLASGAEIRVSGGDDVPDRGPFDSRYSGTSYFAILTQESYDCWYDPVPETS